MTTPRRGRSPRILRPLGRWALAALALALVAIAQPGAAVAQVPYREAPAIPPALQPYVGWVLHDHKDLACVRLPSGPACVWPGVLTIDVERDAATFALDVWLDRPGRVALPGGARRVPIDVRDGGAPALLVRDDEGAPFVQLMAGHHKVSGRLLWSDPPETLAVPADFAQVALSVAGKPIERPRREGSQLWLGQEAHADEGVRDSLRVRVFRRFDDGVPLRMTTRLEVQAAGRARDVGFGVVLPTGAIATDLDGGGLPAVIGGDGALRLHVRPGTFVVTLQSVFAGDPQAVQVPAHASATGIEEAEAWAFFGDASVRTVELSGLTPVDPARAGLPEDWRGGTSVLARPGETMKLETRRRGQAEPPPDRLAVAREIWLDVDGSGLTMRDRITGDMHRAWRADFLGADGAKLGRVHDDALGRDALITRREAGEGAPAKEGVTLGLDGVELRDGKVNLNAESRLVGAVDTFAAVGWDLDATSLSVSLRLPPGWRLLGADGVDSAPGTWIASWTLLDFFLVLMIAGATARLFGPIGGFIALLMALVCHDQPDAPAWLWLHLLASTALLRVLPLGWLRRAVLAWRVLAGVALLVIAVPFALHQIRTGVYPQVGSQGHAGNAFDVDARIAELESDRADDESKMAEEAMPSAAPSAPSFGGRGVSKRYESNANIEQQQQQLRNMIEVDPKAVVQTGPGVPDWSWSTWRLSWSGPVGRGHRVGLWLLSPRWAFALALLRVLLIVALAVVVLELRKIAPSVRDWIGRSTGVFGVLAPWLLVPGAVLVSLAAPLDAAAQPGAAVAGAVASAANPAAPGGLTEWPPEQALEQLRQRLLAAESCDGPCITTPAARLVVDANAAITLSAEVHAQRDAGWALPRGITLRRVSVDGTPSAALRRDGDGGLWLRVPAGRHQIEVSGLLGQGSSVTLSWEAQSKPAALRVEAEGWRVDGVGPDFVPEDSLQLGRIAEAPAGEDTKVEVAGADLPDWFVVERRLLLGLPWQTETTIRRNRSGRPALVKLPLLEGEAVLAEGVRVEEQDGARVALVAMDRNQTEIVVQGQLTIATRLTLRAPQNVAWTETWHLECSPIWRCATEGIAPISTQTEQGGLQPTFLPWPGEAVEVHVERPRGSDGQAMTVDGATLDVHPGQRLLEATLKLQIRASQGGTRKITLPADAVLQKVEIQGKEQPLSLQAGVLTLPIEPGATAVEVQWQQPWERAFDEAVPTVDLGGAAVNLRTSLHLGQDRWLLWAWGPSWGPAVLFWSHLVVLLLLAALLSRLRGLPLGPRQWLLLCLGFANLPVAVLLVFVAWLIALAWRRRTFAARPAPELAVPFDLVQIALVAATLFAMGALYAAIHSNLLLDIDMQVAGNGSCNTELRWYVDRSEGPMAAAGMISLPRWVWRGAMLLWSLWLVSGLLGWLRWAWECWSDGGFWRVPPAPARIAATAPTDAAAAVDDVARPSGPPRDDLPPPPQG